jgi:hypothetical protein
VPTAFSDIADEVARRFSRDGVEVLVRTVDADEPRVELALDLSKAECPDCVMPADYLRRLIAAGLSEAFERQVTVALTDPRETSAAGAPPEAGYLTRLVRVLDPTASAPAQGLADPGPALGPVAGKVIGFRVDTLWRSWDWVADEWMKLFKDAGAEVKSWRRVQGIHGAEGEALEAEYATFLGSVDAVISGLGNCGSCTAWTVNDAMLGLRTDLASLAVVTNQFADLSQLLSQEGGFPGLRRHVLPYPLDTLPEAEVRKIARDHFVSMSKRFGAEL